MDQRARATLTFAGPKVRHLSAGCKGRLIVFARLLLLGLLATEAELKRRAVKGN